jgi:hypothetical protein
MQRPVERGLVLDAGCQHRFGRGDSAFRPERQPGGAQQPGEQQDVLRDPPAVGTRRDDVGRY